MIYSGESKHVNKSTIYLVNVSGNTFSCKYLSR